MRKCCSSIAERWVLTPAAACMQHIKCEQRDDPCVLRRPRIDAGRSPPFFFFSQKFSFSAQLAAGQGR